MKLKFCPVNQAEKECSRERKSKSPSCLLTSKEGRLWVFRWRLRDLFTGA